LSYICDLCKRVQPPKTLQHKVVVQRREMAKGWQIVKELKVCLRCKESMEKEKTKEEINRRQK